MKTIYLVLPCYNEELVLNDSAFKLNNLMEGLIAQKTITKESRVIFVDDGSWDNTWTLLEKICEENQEKLLHSEKQHDTIRKLFIGVIRFY